MLRIKVSKFLFICLFHLIFSQDKFEIVVHQSSKLTIHGESNVTEFSCLFEHDISDHKHIVTVDSANGKMSLSNAIIKIPINKFDCGIFLMNQDFRQALGSPKYPHIYIEIESIKLNVDQNGNITSILANLDIKIREVERNYSIEFTYQTIADKFFVVTGKQKMAMRDFEIRPPKAIGGLIYACEEIEIEFNLVLKILQYIKKG